jgi:class 3 adenylate cyclase/tetratricopeptide (TPR) repeat protein
MARFCLACGTRLTRTVREERRVVTVLFCDVVGSTELGEQLDSETLRRLLARYFEHMKGLVERHGGTVEKFIGDAVMAVFGIPVAHEDDALRAIRAASDMRTALLELNVELERDYGTTLELRIGVNTGEVVTGTEERLATGDAINVASRLEHAAEPDEILVGETTVRLVGAAVELEPIEPLSLKGKRERVAAWRLIAIRTEAARQSDSPLIGRAREMEVLQGAIVRVRSEPRCELVTVIGAAGVGKSRLVADFLAELDVPVVRGRCPAYGNGITYWPIVNVIKQLDSIELDVALEPGEAAAIRGLLANEGTATTVDIASAFSSLLSASAQEQPLVVVFDDIQWGEDVFLDLVEHLIERCATAAILVVCMARPELIDRRPGWTGAVELDPLTPEQARKLVDTRIGDRDVPAGLRDRVVTAAGGNPLFVEEMTSMLVESGGVEIVVPPTIQALLAARLDQLDIDERSLLERAAVEGEIFHRGAVAALAQEAIPLDTVLRSLIEKEFVRPERAQLGTEAAYRFRHLLIRDAAYESVPKATRAELHVRYVAWLEDNSTGFVELDELIGYHLEQAHNYRIELAPANAETRALGGRASDRLADAGRRSAMRWDLRAAIALLDRAAALLPADDPRLLKLLPELANALMHAQELDRAETVLAAAIEGAAAAGDSSAEAHALLSSLELKWRRDPGAVSATLVDEAMRAVRIFENDGDARALAQSWLLLSNVYRDQFEMTACQEALAQAIGHARQADDIAAESLARVNYGLALMSGPAPLPEVGRYQQENLTWAGVNGSTRVEAASLVLGGRIQAMLGDFSKARALIERGRALFEDLGIVWALVAVANWTGEVEELAGDLEAAESQYRRALTICETTGDRRRQQPLLFSIARLADIQGRPAEAAELAPLYKETATTDDRLLQVTRRCWRARLLARSGKARGAQQITQQAIELAPPPEAALDRGRILGDAAEIFALADNVDRATRILDEAQRLWERKGSPAAAEKARELRKAFLRSEA